MANSSQDRTRQQSNSTSSSKPGVSGEELTRAVTGNVIEKQDLTQTPASSDMTRDEAIRLAAYYHAERRGFEPGYELEDWLAAEREVSEREGAGTLG